mgnify:FL=1
MQYYQWAVIGAGGAGISAVGKLLDAGIDAQQILWIDPAFKIGDLGKYWSSVPSNTIVRRLLEFLGACKSFSLADCDIDFPILQADVNQTTLLSNIVAPLQWISDRLCKQVSAHRDFIEHLKLHGRCWYLQGKENQYITKNVILAQGALPKKLNFSAIDEIEIATALKLDALTKACQHDDTVAVFGSSHSAIIILENLVKLGIKQIINFYQSPLKFAVDFGDWILFDDTGLKGNAANWAKENLQGQLPKNLRRELSTAENIATYLPDCNKAIYAVGFSARQQPQIENFSTLDYNVTNGIIAPGLFGLGIAYPQQQIDPYGNIELAVGLVKFIQALDQSLPLWLAYST